MAKQKRWAQIQGLHVLNKTPNLRIIVLDISKKCNFNCLYCYGKSDKFNEKGNSLTLKEYYNLFKEAKKIGVQCFWFLGGHENTLNPNYLKMIKKLEELGLYSVTLTNGAAFGDDNIATDIFKISSKEFTLEVAKCKKASVILKCDSLNKNIQNKLSRNSNAYAQIKKAIFNIKLSSLVKPGDKNLPRFGINSVLTKLNYKSIPKVFDYALNERFVYFCDDLLITGNAKKNKEYIKTNENEIKECLNGIEMVLRKHKIIAKPADVINFYNHNCILFDNYIFVLNNGDVIPCAGFNEGNVILGNVRNGLINIKNSKMKLIKKYYSLYGCLNCKKCPCKAHLEGCNI